MKNKFPTLFNQHRICIICEGNKECKYLERLNNLKVWHEQYKFLLVNAYGNGNVPARYQDQYQNGADELVLVFCDTEKNHMNNMKTSSEKSIHSMATIMLQIKLSYLVTPVRCKSFPNIGLMKF